MATRTLQVENSPTAPAGNGKHAPRKKTFAERVRTDPLSTIITVSIDVLSVSIATALGAWWATSRNDYPPDLWLAILFVPVVVATLAARGVYRRRLNREFLDEIGPIEATVAISTMFLLAGMLLTQESGRPGSTVLKIWLCAAVLMPFGRLVRVIVQRSLRRHHHLVAPTLIVGNGRVAGHIINRLEEFPEYGLGPVGIIDAEPWFGQAGDPRPDIPPYLGPPENIDKAIQETGAQNVVIAFSRTQDQVLTHVFGLPTRTAYGSGWSRACSTRSASGPESSTSAAPHCWRCPPTPTRALAVHRQARLRPGDVLPSAAVYLTGLPHPGAPGEAELARADLLPPATGGPRRTRLRLSEIPHHAGTRRRRCGFPAQDRRRARWCGGCRPSHKDRQNSARHITRRAAAVPERAQGRDELGGSPARTAGVRRTLRGADPAIRRAAPGSRRCHRLGSGARLTWQTSIADRAEWDNYYIENFSIALDLKILALTIPAVLRRAE